jgi:hypothetical protein
VWGQGLKKDLSSGKIILLAILAILLATALAFALTDLVRNVLAVPVTQFFYFLGLMVKSTPQVYFWGMLLIFLLIVAGKSVQAVRKPEHPEFAAPVRSTKRERVAVWAAQVNQALRGDHYSRSRLIEFLAGLALELDAQEERISIVEIRQRIESGDLDLPPEIANFLKARLTTGYIPRPSFWRRLAEKLAHFWNSFSGKNKPEPGVLSDRLTQEELEKIIQYLEDRLEV